MIRRSSAGPAATVTVLDHVRSLLAEMDLRYQQRFEGQNKAVDTALVAAGEAVTVALMAAEKAVAKAEVAAERRFDWVREFRITCEEVIAHQIPRSEAEQQLNRLQAEIDELKLHDESRTGRSAGARSLWGYAIGAVGLMTAIVGMFVALR
jgi:hypothetical protein